MINREQVNTILELVKEIRENEGEVTYERYFGTFSNMDRCQKDLDSSVARLEQFLESITA